MKKSDNIVLQVIHVVFWIIAIGLSIKAGALIVSFFVSLFVNPAGAKNLFEGLDLSRLRDYSQNHYIATTLSLIILTCMKAAIAYQVVWIFKGFSLEKPFNSNLAGRFLRISYLAIGTGLTAAVMQDYTKWLGKKGVAVPLDWGASEILFFAGVIYLLALVFRKGTELQLENDLTV